jgi:transposase
MLSIRRFEFPMERAIFASVLHRMFSSGSDRSAQAWLQDVRVEGAEGLECHHLYRAMRFLGENKDRIEEDLFHNNRDLFTKTSLAFFDTTTLYFEGCGGESLGQFGHSKDHRPDLKQMVVGAVLSEDGRPLACQMWPGNQADARSLLPVVDSTRKRFGIEQVCWVADRGMATKSLIEELDARSLTYILGARLRRVKEIKEEVLSHPSPYQEVASNLQVKEVKLGERRYVVCYNPEQAAKDAADRESILLSLKDTLEAGPSALVGNQGYRRYLKIERGSAVIDQAKVQEDERYDGKFVLRTNSSLPASDVALHYKQLLLVEQFFRAAKSLLDTRPIFHKFDATIVGHVFVSFLALVLVYELKDRLKAKGFDIEWSDILRDLEALCEVEVSDGDQTYLLRTELRGICGKVLQAAGAAIPPTVRISSVVPRP